MLLIPGCAQQRKQREQHAGRMREIRRRCGEGDNDARSIDTGFSLGLGAYAVLISGAYLTFRGIKRYLGRQG